jgi:hypothetical protein
MNKLMGYWIGSGMMLVAAIVGVTIVSYSHASNVILVLVALMVGCGISQAIRAAYLWRVSHGVSAVESALRLSLMWSLCVLITTYCVRTF